MIAESRGADEPEAEGGSLTLLTLLALVVGAISGAVVALFMLLLEQADHLRDLLITLAHAEGPQGFWLLVAACAAATGVAASLVRRISPQSAGSGIPHVEAVLNGLLPQAPFRMIPVKFIGGALAIGAGLALGREGPSVHMAGTLGHLVGRTFRRNWPDCRVLLAAGAGAGLATAFNAPIAGAVFVLASRSPRSAPRPARSPSRAPSWATGRISICRHWSCRTWRYARSSSFSGRAPA
jgi:CIC family chloride channel protein